MLFLIQQVLAWIPFVLHIIILIVYTEEVNIYQVLSGPMTVDGLNRFRLRLLCN